MALKELENVDLFNMSADDESLDVFNPSSTNQDGIYRPKLEDAKDKKIGYRATVRFLPNLLKNGKPSVSAVQKHQHYISISAQPQLSGYYDCAKNFTDKCDLCTNFWKLKNSKNQTDVEKSELLSRTTKYYSYVLIIEDEQHPDLVGKIMIFSYGYSIKEKINSEKNGEVGEPCNVFDLATGKDFKLIIKQKGEFPNYDSSAFLEQSPIKIWNEEKKEFRSAPINTETGKIDNPKVQEKIKNFLLTRDVELDDFTAKEWDEETKGKVSDIIEFLNGNDISRAERKSRNANSETTDDDNGSDFDEFGEEMDENDFFGA